MNTIAHVGWTKSPEDLERLTLCFQYLDSIDREDLQWCKPKFFDLGKGKDFMMDTGTYKAVVLHFVFRGGFYVNQDIQIKQSPMRISPLASWGAWRKRLAATEADYIITFGGISEVNATFLVDIPNYGRAIHSQPYEYREAISKLEQPTMAVFVKEAIQKPV